MLSLIAFIAFIAFNAFNPFNAFNAFNAGVSYRKHKPLIEITPQTGWKGVKNSFASVSSYA